MTTLTTTIQQCQLCELPLTSRSLAADVCTACFDRDFQLCKDCGALILTVRNERFGRYSSEYGFPFCWDKLCPSCYRVRQNNDYSPRHRMWRPTPFSVSIATYHHIRSKRKYGVEIETSACSGYSELEGRTTFGCKDDCTIRGREFDSPILYGDEGLSCITEFAGYANHKGWQTDEECGCHIHLDMREETSVQLATVIYAYRVFYPLWRTFIPRHRAEGEYCAEPCWSARAVPIGVSYLGLRSILNPDRYEFLNIEAYRQHKTLEVRALEGTLDATTICNWITCHCRFIDAVRDLSRAEIDRLEQWSFLTQILGPRLSSWLHLRRQNFYPTLDLVPVLW